MTPRERVIAAINLEETDRIPVGVGFDCFVARQAGVVVADYLNDFELFRKLNHESFELLGGVDAVQIMPAGMMKNPVDSLRFMPMKPKIPGRDIDADSIIQYDEFELMPEDGYDQVMEMGWEAFVEEVLVPRAYPDSAEDETLPGETEAYDLEPDRAFLEDHNAYFLSGVPQLIPFELFSFSRSVERFTVDLFRRPEKVIAAMDAIMPELLEGSVSTVRDTDTPVLIPVSRGSNGFISPAQFEKFVFPYMREAVEIAVNQGSLVIFHLDQSWTKFLPYFREFPEGRYILQLDGMTDIVKAKEILGNRMCIMGDVPAPLFSVQTVDDMKDYCKKLIDVVGKGGGFILSAGCTVPDTAKFRNLKAMIDTARTYRPN